MIDRSLSPKESPLFAAFNHLLEWADRVRRLGVRANADTPNDARVSVLFGAEGIGLCRTEHMFFGENRISAVRQMIVAENLEDRRTALAKLLPMQREDFLGIFREMGERPVTIRLLDPPLHEFLPHEDDAVQRTAADLGIPAEKLKERVRALAESNPMLGHRGCRLGITYPEIYETQVRAIFEAAAAARREGLRPRPEVMIPLVGTKGEFETLKILVDQTARKVSQETGDEISYHVGTMIEIPRAALRAAEIAENCDFFSFGTNDLTQMTYGYSRDDAGSFLPAYIKAGILPDDPFATIDQPGVGELVALGTKRGREAKPGSEGGGLRRARRRSPVDRVLPPGWPRLRLVLAFPGAGRPARRGACRARRGALVDRMSLLAAAILLLTRAPPTTALRPISSSSPPGSGRAIRPAPRPQALAVRGGRIVAVGTNAEIESDAQGRRPSVVEGKGRRVVPGFIDCHTHMSMGGLDLLAMDLRTTKDPAEFTRDARRLREDAARRGSG